MNSKFGWKRVDIEPPPRDAGGLVALAQITCECGKGGQIALPAGRVGGEWVIGYFDHSFEIDYWMRLPEYPAPIVRH